MPVSATTRGRQKRSSRASDPRRSIAPSPNTTRVRSIKSNASNPPTSSLDPPTSNLHPPHVPLLRPLLLFGLRQPEPRGHADHVGGRADDRGRIRELDRRRGAGHRRDERRRPPTPRTSHSPL